LASSFAKNGWLHLHFLKVGDRRIAFQFAVTYRNRAFSLKPGYDPSFANCSPSSLLCMLFLERAFDQGFEEYDLLGIAEEWKLQWTQSSRSHEWLFIFSKSVVPSLLYTLKFQLVPALRQRRSYRRFVNSADALRRRFGHAESGS
jgi:CelD/BcsL family acetyltransferase involved in cellulose biosynthesis